MKTRALFFLMVVSILAGCSHERPAAAKDELELAVEDWNHWISDRMADWDKVEKKKDPAAKARVDLIPAQLEVRSKRTWGLVQKYPKSPAQLEAILLLARFSFGEISNGAWKLLLNYTKSEKVGPACQHTLREVIYSVAETEKFLREVIEKNPHRNVRGQAVYWLANVLIWRAEAFEYAEESPSDNRIIKLNPENLRLFKSQSILEYKQEAETLYERVIKEYSDLELGGRVAGVTLGKAAAGKLFDLRHLEIQPVTEKAPPLEIDGKDAVGKSFKLSDYRGKVVLLTFSGNWCGPCRAMYPEEREIVARYHNKPFVMLSVNTDEKLETLKNSMASPRPEITWRCWWDPEREICTAMGISGYPTIFILDHQGVVRFKNTGSTKIVSQIDALLAEVPH